jgi:hypothetical protein
MVRGSARTRSLPLCRFLTHTTDSPTRDNRLPADNFAIIMSRLFPPSARVVSVIDTVAQQWNGKRIIGVDNCGQAVGIDLMASDGVPRLPVSLNVLLQAADGVASWNDWDPANTAFFIAHPDDSELASAIATHDSRIITLGSSFRFDEEGTPSGVSARDRHGKAIRFRVPVSHEWFLINLLAHPQVEDMVFPELSHLGYVSSAMGKKPPSTVCTAKNTCTRRLSRSPCSSHPWPVRKACGLPARIFWEDKYSSLDDQGASLFEETLVEERMPFLQYTDVESSCGHWRQWVHDCLKFGCVDGRTLFKKINVTLPSGEKMCNR